MLVLPLPLLLRLTLLIVVARKITVVMTTMMLSPTRLRIKSVEAMIMRMW